MFFCVECNMQTCEEKFLEKELNGYKEYIKFCECILSEKRYCVTYSFEELQRLTYIKRIALTKILEDVSYICFFYIFFFYISCIPYHV